MRLPENSQSRQKVLALIGLGAVAAAYGLWIGVYAPLLQSRDDAAAKGAAVETELQTSRAQIRRQAEMQRDLAATLRELRARSEQDMLHPRLGNYLLQAREILTQAGLAAGAEGIQVAEIGLVDPPKPPKKAPPKADPEEKGAEKEGTPKEARTKEPVYRVKAYSARVTGECGTEAFLAWIRALEKANPLLAVSQITMVAQPEKPLLPLVRFEVQWPVWVDPDMRERVRQKAAEVLGDVAK